MPADERARPRADVQRARLAGDGHNANNSDSFQFWYDGRTERVREHHANGDDVITLEDLYERRTPVTGQPTHRFTVVAPGGPVAQVISGPAGSQTVYLHAGHSGSIELITDANRGIVDRLAYEPFGARLQPTPPQTGASAPSPGVRIGFTGAAHDDEALLQLGEPARPRVRSDAGASAVGLDEIGIRPKD